MTGSRIPYLLFNPLQFKRENRWKLQVIVGEGAGKSDKAGQSWTHSFEQERTEETERRSKQSAACYWRGRHSGPPQRIGIGSKASQGVPRLPEDGRSARRTFRGQSNPAARPASGSANKFSR